MAAGVSPNVGSFRGGGTLRAVAMGMELGEPIDEHLATMRRVMAQAMEEGAFGVSCALIYPPSAYSSLRELIEVNKVVAEGSLCQRHSERPFQGDRVGRGKHTPLPNNSTPAPFQAILQWSRS